jgi:nuclear RNA export factor
MKTDRDGDLNMDVPVTTSGSSQSNAKRAKNNSTPTGPAARSSRKPKATAKAQQIIQRVINGDHSGIVSQVSSRSRGSRRADAVPSVTLKVEGLKASKAAANEGGGLKELLNFLERKAPSTGHITRHVRIKKVCYRILPTGLGGYEATHILRNRYYAR